MPEDTITRQQILNSMAAHFRSVAEAAQGEAAALERGDYLSDRTTPRLKQDLDAIAHLDLVLSDLDHQL